MIDWTVVLSTVVGLVIGGLVTGVLTLVVRGASAALGKRPDFVLRRRAGRYGWEGPGTLRFVSSSGAWRRV